jgi:hypothetical protein
MKTNEEVHQYTPWETIQEEYPDMFVLIKDLAYGKYGRFIGGTVVYANRDRKKVIDKDVELQMSYTMTLYTRGERGDRARKMLRIF